MRITSIRAAACGGILALGLGSTQAAMAGPAPYDHVPCIPGSLESAMSNAISGETLFLDPGCAYYLDGGLTDSVQDLTIVGYESTLEGGGYGSDFTILTVGYTDDLTLDGVNFSHGGGNWAIYGGAIDNDGNLTVNGGFFTDNDAGYGGAIDNGGVIDYGGTVTINGSVFIDNRAEYGGAIDSYGDDTWLTISGAYFADNDAQYGGAIGSAGVTVLDTDPPDVSHQVVIGDGTTTVADSSFLGNVAAYGGAIDNEAIMTLQNVTGVPASGNTFTGNQAYQGGAIYNDGVLTAADSLIAFNAARGEGGGIYNYGYDCAILTLTDDDIHGNVVDNIYTEGFCPA